MDSQVPRPRNLAHGTSQTRIALDSSYLIALLCDWHAKHHKTLRSYQHWHDLNAQIVLTVHAILECYSVLTRIPAPYRLPPEVARQTIDGNFARTATIVGVRGEGIWKRIESLSRLGVGGGQVYDALIAWCAVDAGATVLLTWNPKHFMAISPPELDIKEP
jgi:predicted nucleic acid-binding protein